MKLQTVNGSISKIATHILLSNKQDANQVAMETLHYCKELLGNPTEQQTGFFIWDTTDGNVILQTGELRDGFAIAFSLTSRSVRNFAKK